MQTTSIAPANIALIKYWGKQDYELNLPLNDSISMNLSSAKTITKVELSKDLQKDNITLNGSTLSGKEYKKIVEHLNFIRQVAGKNIFMNIETSNAFPTGAGIASSASGFAALTLATTKALGLELSEKELSTLARKGSGSASRSIPDGFVIWHKGKNNDTSFAESLFPADHWDLHDIIVIVDSKKKSKPSSFGHQLATTSPLLDSRLRFLKEIMPVFMSALESKDIEKLGLIIEQEALCLHSVMMTSTPSIFYWTPSTLEVIDKVKNIRKKGIPVFFTMDAGPNVHVICEGENADFVEKELKTMKSVLKTIDNKVAKGAHLC